VGGGGHDIGILKGLRGGGKKQERREREGRKVSKRREGKERGEGTTRPAHQLGSTLLQTQLSGTLLCSRKDQNRSKFEVLKLGN
jgi:hypothetical protein